MPTKYLTFVWIALLAGSLLICLPVLRAARADSSPYQSQPFVMDGVITRVDPNRERVTITGSNKRIYTLDTAEADITLADGNRAGMTPDLSPGMRVHVTGRQIASGLTEVEHLGVLADVRPLAPGASAAGEDIQLRGTVDSIDTRRGAFVVHIQDHTRTVYLADDTDLTGMNLPDSSRFPVKTGDRVSVAGRLQPDGSVLAGAISLSKTVAFPKKGEQADRVLLGQISSTSNRYTSRDIKIRLADNREIKIKVRHGLAIRRDGRTISVHDLRTDDDVRVIGRFDGNDFQADRIDVLHSDNTDDPNLTGRRGL